MNSEFSFDNTAIIHDIDFESFAWNLSGVNQVKVPEIAREIGVCLFVGFSLRRSMIPFGRWLQTRKAL